MARPEGSRRNTDEAGFTFPHTPTIGAAHLNGPNDPNDPNA
jgi:hypothetical protein